LGQHYSDAVELGHQNALAVVFLVPVYLGLAYLVLVSQNILARVAVRALLVAATHVVASCDLRGVALVLDQRLKEVVEDPS
jgi:hypothetical protein